jgi:hypothetical protein
MDAVYSNGFVTFETSHFSKYVVVKLTPEELCKKMNVHNMVLVEAKEASCTEYGQIMYACTRCGHVENELTPMLDHDFDIDHEHSVAPTYDAEGYTEYVCRTCDATKRVILPKKPRPADNRIQNLINSLFEDDYFTSMEGLEQIARVAGANSQIKLTEDGNVYMISKAVNQETGEEMISIVDMTNGLAYSVSESSYNVSTANINFDLNKVKKYVYAVTDLIPTDLGNEVLDKVIPILFTTETTENAVTLTFDMEKLLTLYDNLTTKTIAELIDIYVGENASKDLVDGVGKFLDMTVGELMEKLEGYGITVEAIAELTKEFNNGTPLFEAEAIKPLIAMASQMKVLDVINVAIPMLEQMMMSKKESQVAPGPKPISSDPTTPLVQETETEEPVDGDDDASEEEPTFTPITKETIMNGLNMILAMDLSDILAMVPNGETILAQLPTKEMLQALTEDLLTLKITLNNKYQFKKLEAEVTFNEAISAMAHVPAGMEVNISAKIEHENKEDLFDVQQKIKEIKDTVSILDISLDNYEWFIEELDKYLDTTGNNNLTYTFTKNNEGYEITSSKFDVTYLPYQSTTPQTIKAYYVIRITNSYYDYKYLSKDKNGNYYKYMNVGGSIVYVYEDGQTQGEHLIVPSVAYYNPTTKKYSLGLNSYEDVGVIEYEVITPEEFALHAYNVSDKDDYVFYKMTNIATNKVSYSYNSKNTYFSRTAYILTFEESGATKQTTYLNGIKVNYYYGVYSYYIAFNVTDEDIEYAGVKSNSKVLLSVFDNGLRANYEYSRYETVSTPVTVGNFSIQFLEAETVDACCQKVKIKVSPNGTNYTTYSGYVYNHQGERTTTRTQEGCIDHIVEKCSTCNRVLDRWDSESHDLEFRYIEKAQGTMPGIRIAYCKNCNYIDRPESYYCYHESHGTHTDEDGNVTYECNECHYTWSGYEYPVIFLEQVADEYEYKIRYQLRYFKDFNDFSYTYHVAMMIGVMGEDGEYVMTPLNEVTYIYGSEVYREYDKQEFSYTFFSYNKSEVEEALDELDLDDEYVLFIAVTNSEGYAYMVVLE